MYSSQLEISKLLIELCDCVEKYSVIQQVLADVMGHVKTS